MCMLGVGGCPEQKGGVGRVSVEGDGFLQDHQGEKGGAWLLWNISGSEEGRCGGVTYTYNFTPKDGIVLVVTCMDCGIMTLWYFTKLNFSVSYLQVCGLLSRSLCQNTRSPQELLAAGTLNYSSFNISEGFNNNLWWLYRWFAVLGNAKEGGFAALLDPVFSTFSKHSYSTLPLVSCYMYY